MRMSISGSRKTYFIDRIEIKERDPSMFADLAFFFDRKDALDDIATLRKAWIDNILIPHDQIDNFINRDMNSKEAKKFWWKIWPQIFQIARKYGLRENFISPIISATLSGVVTEKDYLRVFKETQIGNLPEEFRLSEKAIFVSNYVRDVDLQTLRTKVDDKSIATVKRDREWYWLYQSQNIGYKRLSDIIGQPMQTVRTAINAYSEKLSTYYRIV